MSWQERQDDATRAGIAVGFFLFGASVVAGVLVEGGPARLVLALSAPVTAVLAGVCAYRSARDGGSR